MTFQHSTIAMFVFLCACSSSVDLDPTTTLPGSWECDDGIVITFNSNGRYEWRVPEYDDVTFYTESNEYIRVNEGGGYSILGGWRIDAGKLELDMFGEADRYSLNFDSDASFRMSGPDVFRCRRQ